LGFLHLDHNVSRYVGPLLQTRGHGVVLSRDIGADTLTDDAVLLSAVRANRILVTHNRNDFRMLHDAWLTWPAAFGVELPPHPGILVMDVAPPADLAAVLIELLASTSAGSLANTILWWHRRDGWRQPMAGGLWGPYQPPGDAERV